MVFIILEVDMANQICLRRIPASEWLSRSNVGTNVFMDILASTNNHLHGDEHDNKLVQWILNHHETRIGNGFSGFDIGKMPWVRDNFYEERDKLISIIKKMKNKANWTDMGYEPNEKTLLGFINQFIDLLLKMSAEDIFADNSV